MRVFIVEDNPRDGRRLAAIVADIAGDGVLDRDIPARPVTRPPNASSPPEAGIAPAENLIRAGQAR